MEWIQACNAAPVIWLLYAWLVHKVDTKLLCQRSISLLFLLLLVKFDVVWLICWRFTTKSDALAASVLVQNSISNVMTCRAKVYDWDFDVTSREEEQCLFVCSNNCCYASTFTSAILCASTSTLTWVNFIRFASLDHSNWTTDSNELGGRLGPLWR